ncbi:c-type cytochrome domain-containing protein [Litorivivens sp.]|uniref:c-type cytochrome domain-containing protein n=1 Tax=Litorivivens sp. TaxID=2020868 RepID=UPI00356AC2F3
MTYLAFLSDFHPVAVHFPIALLPLAALLFIYRRFRPDAVNNTLLELLLWLAFWSCVVAVLLGFGNRYFNGHSGEAIDAHARIALATTLLVFVTAAQWSFPTATRQVMSFGRSLCLFVWRIVWRLVVFIGRLVWGLVRFLLLPLRVLVWLSRRLVPPLDRALSATKTALVSRIAVLRSAIARPVVPAPNWAGLSLGLCLILVAITGLRGANLSHGEAHLVRNMPQPLKTLLGVEQDNAASQLDRAFFEHDVLPVFKRSCIKCHGEHKQKKGLRLDSYEAVVASGVVHFQDPHGSELLRRLLLPPDDAAVMPPQDKGRELQSDDIGVVIHWLQGHSLESLAKAEGGLPTEIKTLARRLPPVDDETLSALNVIPGMTVRRLVNNVDLLLVNLSYVPESDRSKALSELALVSDHIFHLDISGAELASNEWAQLRSFSNLERLNLAGSNIDYPVLQTLSELRRLKWLNLHRTSVTVPETELRSLMPSLATLYLPRKLEDS